MDDDQETQRQPVGVPGVHQTDEGRALLQKMQTAIGITKGEAAQKDGVPVVAAAESKTITNLTVEIEGEDRPAMVAQWLGLLQASRGQAAASHWP